MAAEYWQVIKCCPCGLGDNLLGLVTELAEPIGYKDHGNCPDCGRQYREQIVGLSGKPHVRIPLSFLRKLPPVNDKEDTLVKEKELVEK